MDGLPHRPVPKSFAKLQKLYKLVFNGFIGRCSMLHITNDMLVNLQNLTRLQIKNCRLTSVDSGAFSSLTSLEQLDLSYNEELEFKNVANITQSLHSTEFNSLCLNKIHKTFGGCTELTATDLQYLNQTQIKYISLNSNRLSFLHIDAVKFIPSTFVGISLEDNKLLVADYIIEIFRHMKQIFCDLEVLILSKQHIIHNLQKLLQPSETETETIFTESLQTENHQADLQKQVQGPSLEVTDTPIKETNNIKLRSQVLAKTYDTFQFHHTDHALMTSDITICKNCDRGNFPIKMILPPKLKILDVSDYPLRTHLEGLCVCEPNNLTTFRFSRNFLWRWEGSTAGFNNLLELDLSWNYCQRISYTLLHGMPYLKRFNASKNLLAFSLSKDEQGETFIKQTDLRVLDLTDNKLRYIPAKLFKGLKSLETLSLGNNQLSLLHFNLDHMLNLTKVDLHNNFLGTLPKNACEHFDRIATVNNLTLDLSSNRLKCNCQTMDFIKWLTETNVNLLHMESYLCKFDNGSLGNLTFATHIYTTLEKDCTDYLNLIFGTGAVIFVLLVAVLCGLLYRYRWNLRYMYYSAKIRSKGYIHLNAENGEYDHDVFVSYSDIEGSFVRRCVVPELEEKRGIRLLVHDRDFRPGHFVTDNIMQAITTCRKTLIIMSKSFLRSNWCCYEMNMARMEALKTGRDVLCILMKEEVSLSGLPLEVRDVIEEQTYTYIPSDPEHQQEFWDKLKSSLLD